MAIFRNIHLSFWTDPKVDEDFTPEDKYFYLYVLTNPHTNLVGCYEIGIKQMSRETGYATETIERLINRLEEVHGVIEFSKTTKELYVKNWSKYNWTSSSKLYSALVRECERIKCKAFREKVMDKIYGIYTVSESDGYPMDTTDTDTDTDTVSGSDSFSDAVKEIIEYLNSTCGTEYRTQTAKTRNLIKARMNEKFTVEDFKTVIKKKNDEWGSDKEMSKYLRPETLFGTKFESYLNQKSVSKRNKTFDLKEWASK